MKKKDLMKLITSIEKKIEDVYLAAHRNRLTPEEKRALLDCIRDMATVKALVDVWLR
jgi:hypothetical protein